MKEMKSVGAPLLLILLVALVAQVSLQRALPILGWPDEWIYLTVARNIVEKGTLDTNFYIASSIEALGYPHRDVHLPGYALALATASPLKGFSLDTAILVNVLCHGLTVLASFFLARAFLSPARSLLAAALVSILPPYPGYLAIAYPEHVTAAALIVLLAVAVRIEGRFATFMLGFGLGVALLFRETLLFALPLFVNRLGLRKSIRFFLPGLLLSMVTVLPPLAAHRAVHPNALYPSALTEASRAPEPLSRLAGTLLENARINLELLFTSNPVERAEDAVLLFVLGLALVGLVASFGLEPEARSMLRAALVSLALLFAAMVVIYVIRERGGVWGGVRALMPLAPLFVIPLCGLRIRSTLAGTLVVGLISVSLYLDAWQIAFFNRYKNSNLEDQNRATRFIEERTRRYAPRRVVGGRYFHYGFQNYPVEVVWNGVDDMAGLDRLYPLAPFDFVVIHRRSPMRFDLRKDARYEWVNAGEGQAAEYQIYRRIAP